MTDWISLYGLTATGFHGVLPEERRDGQRFVVDVRLGVAALATSDRLDDTIDYSVIAKDVVALVSGEPFDLIETLAGRIADRCLAEPLVELVEVVVHKPQAPVGVPFADVTVTTTRSRS